MESYIARFEGRKLVTGKLIDALLSAPPCPVFALTHFFLAVAYAPISATSCGNEPPPCARDKLATQVIHSISTTCRLQTALVCDTQNDSPVFDADEVVDQPFVRQRRRQRGNEIDSSVRRPRENDVNADSCGKSTSDTMMRPA